MGACSMSVIATPAIWAGYLSKMGPVAMTIARVPYLTSVCQANALDPTWIVWTVLPVRWMSVIRKRAAPMSSATRLATMTTRVRLTSAISHPSGACTRIPPFRATTTMPVPRVINATVGGVLESILLWWIAMTEMSVPMISVSPPSDAIA